MLSEEVLPHPSAISSALVHQRGVSFMMSYGHARVEPTFPAFQALEVPALLLKKQAECLDSAQLSKSARLKMAQPGRLAFFLGR